MGMIMKSVNRIFLKLSVLLLPLLLFSCAVNPVTGQRELMLVSEEQELDIGKESAPSLQWEFGGYYHDSALESYLGSIVKRLWSISERPNLPVSFHIQNTSLPNAFALPGNVSITRGLICSMENEAQFAAVIGHEIGHVMARHTAQKLSRMTLQQLGLSIGAAALEGTGGSDVLLQAGAIGSSLLLLKYDREQEIQADRLGVKYMARLGYDPHEAVSAHGVLERTVDDYLKRTGKSRSGDDAISQLLSTHPRTEVRVHEIQAMINELPPYSVQGDGRFSDRFQTAIKKISETNKIYFIYDEAGNYYQKENFSAAEERIKKAIGLDDSQPPFYNLLGLINMQRKDYKGAENAFRKAVSLDGRYQPSLYGLGLAGYFREDYGQAVDYFKKSLSLYPSHAQSHFGLGKTYFLMHKYGEAIPYLQNFSDAAPRHPEIHGLIGICYEKTGDVRSAVIEYGNQLKVAPDNELGRYARNRLTVLSPGLK
jgi:predicted Zn-dependent protease